MALMNRLQPYGLTTEITVKQEPPEDYEKPLESESQLSLHLEEIETKPKIEVEVDCSMIKVEPEDPEDAAPNSESEEIKIEYTDPIGNTTKVSTITSDTHYVNCNSYQNFVEPQQNIHSLPVTPQSGSKPKTNLVKKITKKKSGKTTWRCKRCAEELPDEDSLNIHKCTTIACDRCHKNLLPNSINRHRNTCTGVKTYRCDICEKVFNKAFALKRHIPIHSKIKPVPIIVSPEELIDPVVINKFKPYSCDICHMRFREHSTFLIHKELHEIRKHSCDTCHKVFKSAHHLTVHVRRHTGEKPFTCDICQLKFADTSDLRKHLSSHAESSFKCHLCDKTYKRSTNLKLHVRTHTGEKLHSCSVCLKTFNHTTSLHRHLRIHTGEKPYKCNVCPKVFSEASGLRRHKHTHTEIKPFICHICQKGFTQSGNLLGHMRTHTGEKPHNCNQCEMGFRKLMSLERHIARKHAGQAAPPIVDNAIHVQERPENVTDPLGTT